MKMGNIRNTKIDASNKIEQIHTFDTTYPWRTLTFQQTIIKKKIEIETEIELKIKIQNKYRNIEREPPFICYNALSPVLSHNGK